MPVPANINDLSTAAGSNYPAGTETPTEGDNYIRTLSAFIAQLRDMLNGTSGSVVTINLTVSGNTVIGDAGTDTLVINPSAVTWGAGSVAHTGSHTFPAISVTGFTSLAGSAGVGGSLSVNAGLAVGTTLTVGGAATLSGVADFAANPTGKVTSGEFTPAFTSGSNCSAGTPGLARWIRVGDYVTVNGFVSGLAVTANSSCVFQLTTPVTTSFAASTNASGIGTNTGVATVDGSPKVIYAEPSTSRVNVQWQSGSAASANSCAYQYTYRVI